MCVCVCTYVYMHMYIYYEVLSKMAANVNIDTWTYKGRYIQKQIK